MLHACPSYYQAPTIAFKQPVGCVMSCIEVLHENYASKLCQFEDQGEHSGIKFKKLQFQMETSIIPVLNEMHAMSLKAKEITDSEF